MKFKEYLKEDKALSYVDNQLSKYMTKNFKNFEVEGANGAWLWTESGSIVVWATPFFEDQDGIQIEIQNDDGDSIDNFIIKSFKKSGLTFDPETDAMNYMKALKSDKRIEKAVKLI